MKLIVGLGNPGAQYENTRHNAGEMYVRTLARAYHTSLNPDGKYYGELAKTTIGKHDTLLLIPTTFMNKSGKSVAALANFLKIEPEDILVAHDELDIPVGTGRFKQGGGHGGHNGLRDIISSLGNRKDFWRLRIGIDHPGHVSKVTGWVLNKAPKAEFEQIEDLIQHAINATETFINGDTATAMQTLHSIKPGN